MSLDQEPDFVAVAQAHRWLATHCTEEALKSETKASLRLARKELRKISDQLEDMNGIPQQIREQLDTIAEKLLLSDFTRAFRPRIKKVEGDIEKLREFAQVAKEAKAEREAFEQSLPAHEKRALEAGRLHARLSKERLVAETVRRLTAKSEQACALPIRPLHRRGMDWSNPEPVVGRVELQQMCKQAVADGFKYVFGNASN